MNDSQQYWNCVAYYMGRAERTSWLVDSRLLPEWARGEAKGWYYEGIADYIKSMEFVLEDYSSEKEKA